MEKKARKKIWGVIFLTLFLIQPFLSFTASASNLIDWENPNKNGDNPYKISFDNILTSGLLTQVVGCTGITNKIAEVIYLSENSLKDLVSKLKERKQRARLCNLVKGTAESALGAVLEVNNLPLAMESIINCDAYANQVFDEDTSNAVQKQTESIEKENLIKSCFNGIAYTLAKNQLTSIARDTLNWVNSGFSGDPMYVQNMTLTLHSIERSIVEPAIEELSYGAFPWGNTFIQSYIERIGNKSSSAGDSNLLSGTASDLANYIKDDFEYNSELSEIDNERLRAENAVKTFTNDFSSGGWNGWLALIINDNNNYLGFQSRASKILEEKINEQQEALKEQLQQNDGYLSQTECVKWQIYENGVPKKIKDYNYKGYANVILDSFANENVYSNTKTSDDDVCVETKVITPGSNIKVKVDNTLGIPERQLEIADDINDVLNSVFSVLLSVLQDQGLTGLSSGEYSYTDGNIGVSTFSNSADESGLSNYSSSSGSYDSFDITRDLGNTFIYDVTSDSYLGTWNANKNTITSSVRKGTCYDQKGSQIDCPTSLIKEVAPIDCLDSSDKSKKITCPANVYYVVSTAGKTNLANGTYDGWAVGDRAFWDGASWQNWKKEQAQPIESRGVLQLQEDYSVATKEMLSFLPKIMPMIGELDYCIPGPNPSWQLITTETSAALFELVGAINSDYDSSGTKIEKETRYYRPDEGHELYQNYMNLFKDLDGRISSNFWNEKVINTAKWTEFKAFSSIANINKDKEKETLDEQANLLISDIAKQTKAFNTLYKDIIDKRFGKDSSFWREFDTREDTAVMKKNSGYLPMIASGSKITANIISYDEEISDLITAYEEQSVSGNKIAYLLIVAYNEEISDLITAYEEQSVSAEANIYKLNEIKNEVSKIITKAQDRRADEMIKKIKEEEGLAIFTKQDFENRYKDCLDQENINYYDDLEILSGTENDADRCSDGLDNDRDGFVDENDRDCNGVIRDPDNFDPEDGYGSGAEPGYYRTGYNTETTEPEEGYNRKEFENEDQRDEIDMYKYNTGKCNNDKLGECLRGEATSVVEDLEKYTWTCLPTFSMPDYEDENGEKTGGKDYCSIYKEISETDREKAQDEFFDSLKGGLIDNDLADYILQGFDQKEEDGESLTITDIATKWVVETLVEKKNEWWMKTALGLVKLAKNLTGLVDIIAKFI